MRIISKVTSISLNGVTHTSTDEETLEVLLSQPTGWWATETSCETLGSICRLDLNAEGTQNIDAEVCSRLAVLRVVGHWCGDLGVNQPVTALDIVVIAASSYALDEECLDLFDAWERADIAAAGRHIAAISVCLLTVDIRSSSRLPGLD